MNFPRLCILTLAMILLGLPSSVASACSCVTGGVRQDLANSSVVFRGVVRSIKPFPRRKESDRPRQTVTFTIDTVWKGNPGGEASLHTLEPGSDCIGAHFEMGKEYVVFAESQDADDYWLDKDFWYGWLDVVSRGTKILTVNTACDSTGEVRLSGKVLKELGRGRRAESD